MPDTLARWTGRVNYVCKVWLAACVHLMKFAHAVHVTDAATSVTVHTLGWAMCPPCPAIASLASCNNKLTTPLPLSDGPVDLDSDAASDMHGRHSHEVRGAVRGTQGRRPRELGAARGGN